MISIKLQIEKIREFISLSSYIALDSSLLPILNFIRIEIEFGNCTFTKSNNISFCKHSFITDQDDCKILILWDNLDLLCKSTKEEFVEVSIDDIEQTGTLKAGKWIQEINLTGGVFEDFPVVSEPIDGYTFLNKNLIDSIQEAKVCLGKDKLVPAFLASYLQENKLYASNGYAVYFRDFTETYPLIGMTQIECDMLSGANSIEYSIINNYKIYKSENTIYGFAMIEGIQKGFDYEFILKKIKKENYITVKIDDFISFCDTTMRFSKSQFCKANFFLKGNGIADLLYVDREKKQKNSLEISCTLSGEEFDFCFQPNTFLNVLRSLPYDYINIGNEGGSLSLFNDGDSTYLGAIQKVNDI